MDRLIPQALELLKEESLTHRSVLATPDEMAYFSPKKQTNLKEQKSVEMDTEMKQMVQKILPEVAITSSIPDDASAQKMAHLYEQQHLTAKVLVLSLGETGPGLNFLQNVVKAIHALLVPAQLIEMRKIERENSWDLTLSSPMLQLVLAPPFQGWKTLSLSRFYRENPSTKSHFLKDTPLLLMHPTEAYFKNPDLKRELWKMLSSLLSTST